MQPTPQNGPARTEPRQKDVAVYIDYENLYISLRSTVGKNPQFDTIIEKCREFGRVILARAYADWSEFARVVTSQLFASGVEPIYVPTRKFYDARTRAQATKNSVDIHITIDIMKDVLLQRNIDIFVLVSGDRDFVPLMNQIRATGKEVYAIGVAGCTSSELAVAVDEMFYYHQLLESDEEVAAEQHDIFSKLARAVEIARARGYRATLGVVKPLMREIVGGFDERKVRNSKGVPFAKFKAFCEEAGRLGFIKVVNTGESVELFTAKEVPADVQRLQAERPASGRAERAPGGRAERSPRGARAPRAERVAVPRDTDQDRGRELDRDLDREREAAAALEAPADGEAEVATDSDAEDGQAAAGEKTSGGRRRGRRGGRRRRRAPGEEGSETRAAEDASGTEAPESGEEEAYERPEAAAVSSSRDDARHSGNGGGSGDDESKPARTAAASGAKRGLTRLLAGAAEAARARPAPRAEEVDEEESDDEEAALGSAEFGLPAEAFDDLRVMMDTFKGRAPSQRLLIARLKRGAANGELKGEYQDGQFLMLVRKAIEDGQLLKVSKRFSSGLQWAGSPE